MITTDLEEELAQAKARVAELRRRLAGSAGAERRAHVEHVLGYMRDHDITLRMLHKASPRWRCRITGAEYAGYGRIPPVIKAEMARRGIARFAVYRAEHMEPAG